jgi:putative spermidine/putrescine transport system ATP-binding protein
MNAISDKHYVVIRNLTKYYPGQTHAAVDNIDLSIEKGRMLALLGPSGCGKTTSLRMIAGLITPSGGQISIGGKEITHLPIHKRGLGMVFQSYALFPHMTVAQNVAFGLEMRKVPRMECQRRVLQALQLVKLADFGDHKVTELSGGQQQRIALARALVIEPGVLLLDEPLANLDAKLREAMRMEIKEIQRRTGVTTIFVTHDQDEALSMADQVAVMSDGKVEQIGSAADIYQRPANRFVADFIGRANFLEASVRSSGKQLLLDVADIGPVSLDGVLPPNCAFSLMVRPHHVAVLPDGTGYAPGQGAKGIVEEVSYTGNMITYGIRVGNTVLAAQVLAGATPKQDYGATVCISWEPRNLTLVPHV